MLYYHPMMSDAQTLKVGFFIVCAHSYGCILQRKMASRRF